MKSLFLSSTNCVLLAVKIEMSTNRIRLANKGEIDYESKFYLRIIFKSNVFETKALRLLRNWWLYA